MGNHFKLHHFIISYKHFEINLFIKFFNHFNRTLWYLTLKPRNNLILSIIKWFILWRKYFRIFLDNRIDISSPFFIFFILCCDKPFFNFFKSYLYNFAWLWSKFWCSWKLKITIQTIRVVILSLFDFIYKRLDLLKCVIDLLNLLNLLI